MESKRKNVYIALFVITTIIAGCLAAYFGIMKNKEAEDLKSQIADLQNQIDNINNNSKDNENNQNDDNIVNSNTNNEENKNEAKELITSDADKIKYNEILDDRINTNILQVIITVKIPADDNSAFKNGEFNDSDMLFTAAYISARKHSDEFYKNVVDNDDDNPVKYVNKNFINNYSKKIFGKEINFENTGTKLTDNEVAVGLPTGIGYVIFKAKSLILNEKTDEYTLTFDSVDGTTVSEDVNKINYEQSDILDTYVIKYKEINGSNVILSLDRTYHK